MKFRGKVAKGLLILFDKELFNIQLKAFEGKHVDFTVKLPEKRSSNQQRKWLFGVAYKIISEETGMTTEEVHACEPVAKLRMDYTKKFPTPMSVAMMGMNTKEFNDYKFKLQQWGAEQGWNIPDPNEVDL